jgi:hypothetical protein
MLEAFQDIENASKLVGFDDKNDEYIDVWKNTLFLCWLNKKTTFSFVYRENNNLQTLEATSLLRFCSK